MNGAMQKRLPYVRLDAGFHLARIVDMTPAEAGTYFRRLLIALNTGKSGVMPEADEMLDEARNYYDQKRQAGRRGGLITQGKRSSGASSGALSHTDIQTGKQTYIQEVREIQEAAGAAALSQFEIPSLETFKAFGAERGFQAARVEKCFRHYEASGWKDKDGQPVRNWQAKLSSWMNRPELISSGEPEIPIPLEESRRREAEERRSIEIHESAKCICAEQSWIECGKSQHHGRDAKAEIQTERGNIKAKYGEPGLADLDKVIAKMAAAKTAKE